jgi:hypothetical protein
MKPKCLVQKAFELITTLIPRPRGGRNTFSTLFLGGSESDIPYSTQKQVRGGLLQKPGADAKQDESDSFAPFCFLNLLNPLLQNFSYEIHASHSQIPAIDRNA